MEGLGQLAVAAGQQSPFNKLVNFGLQQWGNKINYDRQQNSPQNLGFLNHSLSASPSNPSIQVAGRNFQNLNTMPPPQRGTDRFSRRSNPNLIPSVSDSPNLRFDLRPNLQMPGTMNPGIGSPAPSQMEQPQAESGQFPQSSPQNDPPPSYESQIPDQYATKDQAIQHWWPQGDPSVAQNLPPNLLRHNFDRTTPRQPR